MSDGGVIRNQRVLGEDNDAVAYEVRTAWSICLDEARFIQQSRVLSDANVLVDDGSSDDGSLPYADSREALAKIAAHLFEGLVEICAHHERSLNLHAFGDPAAQTHHGIRHLCAVDDATLADDRIVDLGLFDL